MIPRMTKRIIEKALSSSPALYSGKISTPTARSNTITSPTDCWWVLPKLIPKLEVNSNFKIRKAIMTIKLTSTNLLLKSIGLLLPLESLKIVTPILYRKKTAITTITILDLAKETNLESLPELKSPKKLSKKPPLNENLPLLLPRAVPNTSSGNAYFSAISGFLSMKARYFSISRWLPFMSFFMSKGSFSKASSSDKGSVSASNKFAWSISTRYDVIVLGIITLLSGTLILTLTFELNSNNSDQSIFSSRLNNPVSGSITYWFPGIRFSHSSEPITGVTVANSGRNNLPSISCR